MTDRDGPLRSPPDAGGHLEAPATAAGTVAAVLLVLLVLVFQRRYTRA